jgi:inositol-hexakisphosphate kinase
MGGGRTAIIGHEAREDSGKGRMKPRDGILRTCLTYLARSRRSEGRGGKSRESTCEADIIFDGKLQTASRISFGVPQRRVAALFSVMQTPPSHARRSRPVFLDNFALKHSYSTSISTPLLNVADNSTMPASPSTPTLRSRRASLSSDASSDLSSGPDLTPHLPHSAGMGRKVAASLQLFKETSGRDDDEHSDAPQDIHFPPTVPGAALSDNVAEAQFQFVKRSDWPDRETVASRRQKSASLIGRMASPDPINDGEARKERRFSLVDPPSDMSYLRRNSAAIWPENRGRRKERSDSLDDILILSRPCSHRTSPSPSLSRYSEVPSPRRPRTKLPAVQTEFQSVPSEAVSPVESSTYSTDDDSTWETASTNTTMSTTSAQLLHATVEHYHGDESDNKPYVAMEELYGHSFPFDVEWPQDHLPHIPLRPFRNQVGGHSAIYKFTKQAVCKVRHFFLSSHIHL